MEKNVEKGPDTSHQIFIFTHNQTKLNTHKLSLWEAYLGYKNNVNMTRFETNLLKWVLKDVSSVDCYFNMAWKSIRL